MNVVFAAEPAVLLVLNSTRLGPAVLGCSVVTTTAPFAFQCYLLSRHDYSQSVSVLRKTSIFLEPMTRFELVTSSLPRMRSTN